MNIAICGALRAGKDVVGDYLCERYGYTTFAFGDGLTSVCQALYPNQFLDGKKPRALLQGFGQDARKYMLVSTFQSNTSISITSR